MVQQFEANEDAVRELVTSGARHAGAIVGLFARTVDDVRHQIDRGRNPVAGTASAITDAVTAVAQEVGEWLADTVEMRHAAKRARRDHRRR